MSRIKKEIGKILNNQTDIDFETIDRILKHFGYKAFSTGSHYTYRKSESEKITVPRHKPVGAVYVKAVIKLLNLGVWYDKN